MCIKYKSKDSIQVEILLSKMIFQILICTNKNEYCYWYRLTLSFIYYLYGAGTGEGSLHSSSGGCSSFFNLKCVPQH